MRVVDSGLDICQLIRHKGAAHLIHLCDTAPDSPSARQLGGGIAILEHGAEVRRFGATERHSRTDCPLLQKFMRTLLRESGDKAAGRRVDNSRDRLQTDSILEADTRRTGVESDTQLRTSSLVRVEIGCGGQ